MGVSVVVCVCVCLTYVALSHRRRAVTPWRSESRANSAENVILIVDVMCNLQDHVGGIHDDNKGGCKGWGVSVLRDASKKSKDSVPDLFQWR